jgi:hypothetical protein
VPKIACRSAQLASLAGTTMIPASVAAMRTIVQVADEPLHVEKL